MITFLLIFSVSFAFGASKEIRDKIIDIAKQQKGTYYEMDEYIGGWPPGLDCSGLVSYSYLKAGVSGFEKTTSSSHGPNTTTLVSMSDEINIEELSPGDLVFTHATYDKNGDKKIDINDRFTHVGIFIGNGQLIHAGIAGVDYISLENWKKIGVFEADNCFRRIKKEYWPNQDNGYISEKDKTLPLPSIPTESARSTAPVIKEEPKSFWDKLKESASSLNPFNNKQTSEKAEEKPQKPQSPSGETSQQPRLVLTSSLKITPEKDKYQVGDTLTAKFTITNKGNASITFDKLTVGGRLNGGCPTDKCADFYHFEKITLEPNQSYKYEASPVAMQAGNYHFFVAYYIQNPTPEEKKLLDQNNWNTSIELGEGLTDKDRVKDIVVVANTSLDLNLPQIPIENAQSTTPVLPQPQPPTAIFKNKLTFKVLDQNNISFTGIKFACKEPDGSYCIVNNYSYIDGQLTASGVFTDDEKIFIQANSIDTNGGFSTVVYPQSRLYSTEIADWSSTPDSAIDLGSITLVRWGEISASLADNTGNPISSAAYTCNISGTPDNSNDLTKLWDIGSFIISGQQIGLACATDKLFNYPLPDGDYKLSVNYFSQTLVEKTFEIKNNTNIDLGKIEVPMQ